MSLSGYEPPLCRSTVGFAKMLSALALPTQDDLETGCSIAVPNAATVKIMEYNFS